MLSIFSKKKREAVDLEKDKEAKKAWSEFDKKVNKAKRETAKVNLLFARTDAQDVARNLLKAIGSDRR